MCKLFLHISKIFRLCVMQHKCMKNLFSASSIPVPVNSCNYLVINCVAAIQSIKFCRYRSRTSFNFHENAEICDFRGFDCCIRPKKASHLCRESLVYRLIPSYHTGFCPTHIHILGCMCCSAKFFIVFFWI